MTFILAEDAALKSHIAGVTVSDEKNNNRAADVWFGFPDVEIREQTFPFITIDLLNISQASDRQTSGYLYDSDYQGTVVTSANTFYKYEIPVAYDLVYQITSYSRHPRHDRAIIFQLNQKFPGLRGHLAVPNALGTATSYRHMFLESYLKSDRAEGEHGNKRLLRNIYTIRVVSEMTHTQAATALSRPTQVALNRNAANTWTATNIPSDKIPV
jgi:hypothetical protein